MPAFPRDKPPRLSTPPEFSEGGGAWGLSGKGQFRSFGNVGRVWQEIWPVLDYKTTIIRALITAINEGLRSKTIWTVQHPHLLANYGTASGTATVNGAGQTGDSLAVSSLDGTMKRGDIFQIAGDYLIYDIRANVASSPLLISPPIFVGNSPSNGAVIQLDADNCWFKAVIIGVAMPDIEADGLILAGLTVTWREQPSA